MGNRALDRLVLWAAAIFVVASISAVVGFQWFAAREVDAAYRERSQQIVENGLANFAKTLLEKTYAQAYWDEAVVSLDNRFDPEWAQEYVGTYFWRTEHFDFATVLDRDDKPQFAAVRGALAPSSAVADLVRVAAPFITDVRRLERARGPLPPVPQSEKFLAPIATSGFALIGDGAYVITATLVQPDGTARPRSDRSAIILLAKRLDSATVGEFGKSNLLRDAHLMLGSPMDAGDWSQAALRDPAGAVIATLDWRSRKPGGDLVRETAPALALFALLLAAAAAIVIRKGRAITRELTESEARASHMAYHDRLTGLPNRAALDIAFTSLRAAQQRDGADFAVLCIDIDDFKTVNDTYGHPEGDILLSHIATTLRELAGEDDIIGRIGGDEFMILTFGSDIARAEALATAITNALARPIDLQPGRVFIGASVGIVAVAVDEPLDAAECFRRADLAMYRAKDAGRGRHAVFRPEFDERLKARQALQRDLHQALEDGEFSLHYQPQYAADGVLTGVEALLRWPQAELRGINPATFVRFAEESGQIDALGGFALRRAFADARAWPELRVGINISAIQLRSGDFVSIVERLLAEYGISPKRIELEITESLLLGQEEATLRQLKRLRDLGFRIAVDDFGTGYSGLSYLHLYPIDKVKIDMSFVSRLGHDPQARPLVETIVRLAHALGLEVIAEGVETAQQRAILLAAGCAEFQGFLTGRPMPPGQIDQLLEMMPRRQAGIRQSV